MPNDTSINRTYQQLPDVVQGYDAVGVALVSQPVMVSPGYPGMQVVTVTGTPDRIYIQPTKGQVVLIDAGAATKTVVVQGSRPDLVAVGVAASVPSGSFGFLISNNGGWYFVPSNAATPGVLYLPPLSPVGDDGANITAVLTISDVTLLTGATYNIVTPIDVSAAASKTLNVNGAILFGNMAPTGGTANSVIKSALTIAGTGATTLSVDGTVGLDQITVAAAAGALVLNAWIRLTAAAGAGVQSVYQVLQVAGTTLKLDRPLEIPFVTGDAVEVASVVPRDVKILGPGLISGSGDRGIDFKGMRRGLVTDMLVNASLPGLAAARLSGGIIFDLSSVECAAERCEAVGRNTVANSDVFDVSLGMFGAVLSRFTGCQGRSATTAAVFLQDAYQCKTHDTDGTDCATALAAGIVVNGSVAGFVPTDNLIDGGEFAASAVGMGIVVALRLTARGFICRGSATKNLDIGLGGGVVRDCSWEDFTLDGGAAASGSMVVSATVGAPAFLNMKVLNTTGAIRAVSISCDFSLRGATFRGCQSLNADIFTQSGIGSSYISDVRIFGRSGVVAAEAHILVNNASGQVFLKNIDIQINSANDIAINQGGNCVVELDDTMMTNPAFSAGCLGFYASGATSATYRKGRNDYSSAATPWTLVQSDQGTFAANGATPVPVLFKDIQAATFVMFTRKVNGGTVGVMPYYTVTAATRFDATSVALDTSTYGYKLVN